MDDDFDFDTMVSEGPSENRRFWIYLIALLGIVAVSIVGILLWINVFSPSQQQAQDAEATQTAAALTQMAQAATSTNTQWPSDTPVPTSTRAPTQTTASIAQATTSVPTMQPTIQPTITPTPTALPSTGFADEIGLPGLITLGFALVMVAIVVRRIRLQMSN